MRDTFSLALKHIREVCLPVEDWQRLAGAFAAVVRAPGAEEIYPADSILVVIPTERLEAPIRAGHRVVTERQVDGRIEVTVREVQRDATGQLWLSQRSTDPRFQNSVKLPESIGATPWMFNNEKYALAGLVAGAFIPEKLD